MKTPQEVIREDFRFDFNPKEEILVSEMMIAYADQFKPKWIPCKSGDDVEEGWYWLFFHDTKTGIKRQSIHHLIDVMPYKYATHICKVPLPTKP